MVPLNNDLEAEEECSIPRISLCEGPNVVGRNCIPITDKRLSRKHLTVHGAANGSVEILVVDPFSYFNLITEYVCGEFAFITCAC